jgi:hypothetical protein
VGEFACTQREKSFSKYLKIKPGNTLKMLWNALECSGHALECSGMLWNALECSGNALECSGMLWNYLE